MTDTQPIIGGDNTVSANNEVFEEANSNHLNDMIGISKRLKTRFGRKPRQRHFQRKFG